MAARSNSDFASTRAKTIGCFVLIPCFPVTLVFSPFSPHELPWLAFTVAAVCSLCGLAALCGRPSLIGTGVRELCRFASDQIQRRAR